MLLKRTIIKYSNIEKFEAATRPAVDFFVHVHFIYPYRIHEYIYKKWTIHYCVMIHNMNNISWGVIKCRIRLYIYSIYKTLRRSILSKVYIHWICICHWLLVGYTCTYGICHVAVYNNNAMNCYTEVYIVVDIVENICRHRMVA